MGWSRRVRGAATALVVAVALSGLAAAPRPAEAPPVTKAAVAPRTAPTVSLDLRYVEDGDAAHRLDLFVPGGYTSRRPLVIFIHGGSWTHGSKSAISGGTGQRSEAFRDLLLRHGYAVASVEYRFSQVARFPAQLYDVKAAVRFLRAEADTYRLDSTRFAVAGESAGGHLAQLLGYTGVQTDARLEGDLGVTDVSSTVHAVVSYYGVSDLSRVVPDRIQTKCPRGEHGAASPEGRLIGGDPESGRMAAISGRASPVSHVSVTSPPTLLLHGTRDCLVPALQSTRLFHLLRGLGVTSAYIPVRAPHGGPSFHTTPRITARVVDFLDQALQVDR